MTPQNTLTKRERTLIIIARTALYICATLLFVQFILTLILPTLTFSHNVRNTDPAFDLSSPTSTFAQTADKEKDSLYTTFSASTERSGDTIALTITAHDTNLEDRIVQAYKTYQSWHTNTIRETQEPTNQVASTAPFRAGTIVRSDTEYFIVDDQTLRPIDRPETLIASGYDFNAVETSTSEQRSLYSKGKIFTMRSVHPDGTIFSVSTSADHPKYYEKVGGELIKRTREEVAREKAPDQTIAVSRNDRTTSRSCILRKKSFTRATYSCEIDIRDLTHHTGKDYIFVIGSTQPSEIVSITARITQSPTKQNIQRQIGLILSKIKPQ